MQERDGAIQRAEQRLEIIEQAGQRFDRFAQERQAELRFGFQQAREEAQFVLDGGRYRDDGGD